MWAAVNEALKEILASVIRPIKDWVLARHWGLRVLFLGLVGLIALGAWRPAAVERIVGLGRYALRAATAEDRPVPVGREARENLRLGIGRLADTVEADLEKMGGPQLTPWSASQAAVSLAEANGIVPDRARYAAYVRSQRHQDCFCWSERPLEGDREISNQIGGLAMAAFARLGLPLSPKEMQSVLDGQNAEGWWPLFPGAGRARYSSTYATGWMVLGLVRQRQSNLVAPGSRPAVDRAVRKGSRWLFAARQADGRWPMHPNYPPSKRSESLSAFALFVLHEAGAPDLDDVDREWLDHLPTEALQPADVETYNLDIAADDGKSIDRFGQVRLPWILAATVKAYPSGSLLQKARTLAWLERVLNDPAVRRADTRDLDWVRAEVLLGLAYASRDLGGR